MRPKPSNTKSRAKAPAEAVVKDIRRATWFDHGRVSGFFRST
ncbi:hypothetical protein [Erythrobacter sp. QSSC1-22B]|nr:hypothetical protein [Erythrobacter sp. QSSC1-22B]